jgi:hypothetical protein
VLKGTPIDNPGDTPTLPTVQSERLEAHERAINELAAQVRKLVELQTTAQRASLWVRLRAVLRGAGQGEPR